MIIDIDAGNSSIKWRLHDGTNKLVSSREDHHQSKCLSKLIEATLNCKKKVKQVNIASVCSAEKTNLIIETVRSKLNLEPTILKSTKKIGDIINSYDAPELMGVDRWAAIIAATKLLNNNSYACCVIDAGTATTIDFICPDGKHEGGYILPGIQLQMQSLNNSAGQIDLEEAILNLDLLPSQNTQSAVTGGIILSIVSVIESSLQSYKLRFKVKPKLFITGGNGLLVKENLTTLADYYPDLVLDGIPLLVI